MHAQYNSSIRDVHGSLGTALNSCACIDQLVLRSELFGWMCFSHIHTGYIHNKTMNINNSECKICMNST